MNNLHEALQQSSIKTALAMRGTRAIVIRKEDGHYNYQAFTQDHGLLDHFSPVINEALLEKCLESHGISQTHKIWFPL
jgi:hypothetical protein